MLSLENIKDSLIEDLTKRLSQSGIMFRLFGRVKSVRSLRHKMELKGDQYRSGMKKIQDMIGIRIVLYFAEDVEALEMFLCGSDLVDRSVDNPDVSTFRPQRLNLVRNIPQAMVSDFRNALPEEFSAYLDATYEIQIRTVFSEGWHEVEHDMRYKCQPDWQGCDNYSRQLNGIIATLETAQWSMGAIFREMSNRNMQCGNFHAMLRNQLHIRLADEDFSPNILTYLYEHNDIVQRLHQTDRMVFILTLLTHRHPIPLTYDNVFFLINRFDLMEESIYQLESAEFKAAYTLFLQDA